MIGLVVSNALLMLAVLSLAAVVLRDRFRSTPIEATAPELDTLLRDRLRDRFIVTTASGESFDGLLIEVDDRTVVMRDVSVLKADGAAMPVDGEVILRRDAVAYMQRP